MWCLGVIYHNAEQLRLLKKLYDLCNVNGRVVIESATTRNRRIVKLNVVEIHWPKTYRDAPRITHLPSRMALKSWLEMAGFREGRIWDVYSREVRWQRAVVTGVKQPGTGAYVYYQSEANPAYTVGDAL